MTLPFDDTTEVADADRGFDTDDATRWQTTLNHGVMTYRSLPADRTPQRLVGLLSTPDRFCPIVTP